MRDEARFASDSPSASVLSMASEALGEGFGYTGDRVRKFGSSAGMGWHPAAPAGAGSVTERRIFQRRLGPLFLLGSPCIQSSLDCECE
jgi:hypothetical protein